MSDEPVQARPPAKGYYRLAQKHRAAIANLCAAAAAVAAVVALFATPKIEGAWLRLPALCALIAADAAAWFAFARLRERASPILRGGLFYALAGVSLIACAMHNASGYASLAGGLGLLSAFALRGNVEKPLVKGRDLRVGPRHPMSYLFDQLEMLGSSLVIVLLVWHFVLEAFRIPSGSMAPTLSGDPIWGDRVFVDKVCYEFRDPVRWEPTVFRYPLKRSDPYVKRLIGLPGNELLIAGGDIYVRENEGSAIELLTKPEPTREILWLPLLGKLDSSIEFIERFQRSGKCEFYGGEIVMAKGDSAIFPKGRTSDAPRNIVDHDSSFGDTETDPKAYGRNVCGDVRVRLRVTLDSGGGFSIAIVRDGDVYTLMLKPGAGACALAHRSDNGTPRGLAVEAVRALNLEPGRGVDVVFSLADGVLSAQVDDAAMTEIVGTPLLDALRNRDKQKRLDLSSEEATRMADIDPTTRKARIEMRAGAAGGATVRLLGIERDIYYVGRMLPIPLPNIEPREKPFGVKLGSDQYFVLGDNSPGSKDSRFWIRAILHMKDGTSITGGLDDAGQELAPLLHGPGASPGSPSALQKLHYVAFFRESERQSDIKGTDAMLVTEAMNALRNEASRQGKGAFNFFTEGGGQARVALADLKTIQVHLVPYVERKLFVGRPFAVFLSPRGVKLIN